MVNQVSAATLKQRGRVICMGTSTLYMKVFVLERLGSGSVVILRGVLLWGSLLELLGSFLELLGSLLEWLGTFPY